VKKKKGFRSTMAALIPSRKRSNGHQGAPNDKMTPNHTARDRDGAAAFMTQVHHETNADRGRSNNARFYAPGRGNDDDDDPIPPANSPVGPADHYNEDNPGVTAFLDQGLASAEEYLFFILDQVDEIDDLAVRASMLQLVGSLEAAIAGKYSLSHFGRCKCVAGYETLLTAFSCSRCSHG
jgi:hypothetical protein